MPFRQGQVEIHVYPATDRYAQATCLPVESVRLVLRLQHEAAHERDRGTFPHPSATPIHLQAGQGALDPARNVLLTPPVLVGRSSVPRLLKPGPGPDGRLERNPV